jgi:hypothetical protein
MKYLYPYIDEKNLPKIDDDEFNKLLNSYSVPNNIKERFAKKISNSFSHTKLEQKIVQGGIYIQGITSHKTAEIIKRAIKLHPEAHLKLIKIAHKDRLEHGLACSFALVKEIGENDLEHFASFGEYPIFDLTKFWETVDKLQNEAK